MGSVWMPCLIFAPKLSCEWSDKGVFGHALEIGHSLLFERLPRILDSYNREERAGLEPIPWLAALVCASPYDLALHDAYGVAHGLPVYECYGEGHCNADLSVFLEPAADAEVDFTGKYAADFLVLPRPEKIPVWHLVGGLDPLDESELKGDEPQDGYPVHLEEWIEADGLNCLKIKLRGNDSNWDYERLRSIGCIAEAKSVEYLTTDFNCTVTDPAYVNEILDRLEREAPETHRKILSSSSLFPTTWKRIASRFIRLPKGNPFLWTKALMIGSTFAWAASSGGRELPSRPARRRPGLCCPFVGPRPTGWT